ncbi:MAG: universal stress protein [Rhodocyclaceae bacterium]|nr:universal stress protein [Rhodocyclaceae bacterium]
MNILLAVDGSEHSLRAARYLIKSLARCNDYRLTLLTVQPPADAPEIRSHMTAAEIEAMQVSRGGDVLAPVRAVLDEAGLVYTPIVLIGPVAETIAERAQALGCDVIVMGRRGLGALGSALLGSVTLKVLQLTNLPVTLIK